MNNAHRKFVWTDAAIAELKERYAEGEPAAKIAVFLTGKYGGAATKNTVIGKANRLGLQRHPNANSGSGKKTSPAPKRKKRSYQRRKKAKPLSVPCSKKLALAEITKKQCRWPTEGDKAPYLYCGHEVEHHGPYCAYHRYLGSKQCEIDKKAKEKA